MIHIMDEEELPMSLRSQIARQIAKITHYILTTFTNGGSSLPGKLALKIDPTILKDLAQDFDIIVVTGTNGKTLTTSLIVQALRQKYDQVITNESGSNMKQGIVGALLAEESKEGAVAVLEVDEGSLKNVSSELKPKTFVHTNVFADQLDRYGSIENIYQLLVDACLENPKATVISNADIPLMTSFTFPNRRHFFGFDIETNSSNRVIPDTKEDTTCPLCQEKLIYTYISYANQGNYYCPQCDFRRPDLQTSVTAINNLGTESSSFDINHEPFYLPIAGQYNIYNALAAYAVASEYGVSSDQIRDAFNQVEPVFGRQEVMKMEGKEIIFNLIKNPVGLNQVIQMIQKDDQPSSIAFIINNKEADGIDVDWLKDGNWHHLANMSIEQLYASGMQTEIVADLLEKHVITSNNILSYPDISTLIDQLKSAPTKRIHVIANYTAMLEFRRHMHEKGYLNKKD